MLFIQFSFIPTIVTLKVKFKFSDLESVYNIVQEMEKLCATVYSIKLIPTYSAK